MLEKPTYMHVHRTFLFVSIGIATTLAACGRWENFTYFLIGWFLAALMGSARHCHEEERKKSHV